MRGNVPWQFPEGFMRLSRSLDFWENDGRWDSEGFDWITKRRRPHRLRTALINGQLEAFAMCEDGRMHPVPAWQWSGVYLWGEAYSNALVNLQLTPFRISGYLLVRRQDVEDLWKAQGTRDVAPSPISSATLNAIVAECPSIGLVIRGLTEGFDRSPAKVVADWVTAAQKREESLPAHLRSAPTLARTINSVIRIVGEVRMRWTGPVPDDVVVAELSNAVPILAAAVEVFRFCQTGVLAHGPNGIVLPSQAAAELKKRVAPIDNSKQAKRLFDHVAKMAIPDDKVSGGGRNRDRRS